MSEHVVDRPPEVLQPIAALGRDDPLGKARAERFAAELEPQLRSLRIRLVGEDDRRERIDRRVLRVRAPRWNEFPAREPEPIDDRLRRGRTVVVGEIEKEKCSIRAARDVGDEGLVMVGGDGRQVDELDADVLEVHHPRDGLAGGEGIGRHGGSRPRELREQE
jgi:hypothetical protein